MRLKVNGWELISGFSTLWKFKIGRSEWVGLHWSAVLSRHLLVEFREHSGALHRSQNIKGDFRDWITRRASSHRWAWSLMTWVSKFLPWQQSARLCPMSFVSDQKTQQWPLQGQRYVVSIPYVVYTVTLEKHVWENQALPTNPRSNPSHRHSNPNKDTWRKPSLLNITSYKWFWILSWHSNDAYI